MEKSTCFSLWILCATIVLQRKEYKEGKDREFMEREQEMARELLKGAYDLHVHSAPSHVKRALNDYELMEQAQAAGEIRNRASARDLSDAAAMLLWGNIYMWGISDGSFDRPTALRRALETLYDVRPDLRR